MYVYTNQSDYDEKERKKERLRRRYYIGEETLRTGAIQGLSTGRRRLRVARGSLRKKNK